MSAVARRLSVRAPILVAAAAWIIATMLFPSTHPTDAARTVAQAGPTAADVEGVAESAVDGAVAADAAATSNPTAAAAAAAAREAAAAATGVSRGGVACAPGVRQIPTNSYAPPCIPAFKGSNGGATAPGVTGTTIRIVRRKFPESANSQAVGAVAEQAGAADAETVRAIARVFIEHFEKTFELYGRKVEWVDYESRYGNSTSEAQGRGREEACLDADVVAKELKAFAVIGESNLGAAGGVSGVFAECAAQRGVLVLDGASYASNEFYKKYHPYIWAAAMDCERIVYQVVEYIAKRLAGKPARWAGDDATRAKSRIFGTYVPTGGDDPTCGDLTQSELKRYGLGDQSGSVYRYTLDVSRFPDEAARGVRQFKSDGVTTVVLACDPISVIFLTQSAANQAWYPEWLLIGVALTDVDNLGRLYDQGQVDGHMFGLSQLGATTKLNGPTSEPGRLYQQLTGRPMALGTDGSYHAYTRFYTALQAAGPLLSANAVAQGLWSLPRAGAPNFAAGEWYFQDSPSGVAGGKDYSAIEDSREIYWLGNARSPADGKTGAFAETYGGRRFHNGEWPPEEPPIYPGR